MNKFLLFTTGGGSSSIMNLDSSEVALYNSVDLRTIKPSGKAAIDLFFNTTKGTEVVTLKIKAGKHGIAMRSIAEAINSEGNIIKVADVDTNTFIDQCILGVTIKAQETYIQSITNNSRVKLNLLRDNYESCIISNDDATDDVQCKIQLYDGTNYTNLLNSIVIPVKCALKLERDEIGFDDSIYDMYVTSGDANGMLTFTFNY